MVLSGIKKASARRKIKQFLENRGAVNASEVKKIVVLVDADAFPEAKAFFKLKNLLNAEEIDLIQFSDSKKKASEAGEDDHFFSPADIGLGGSFKNEKLEHIPKKEFDLLIGYTKRSNLAFNLLAAACQANLKVGTNIEDQALYDLVIQTELQDIETFFAELKKYLKTLNMLKNE